jgi:hypothetical protein
VLHDRRFSVYVAKTTDDLLALWARRDIRFVVTAEMDAQGIRYTVGEETLRSTSGVHLALAGFLLAARDAGLVVTGEVRAHKLNRSTVAPLLEVFAKSRVSLVHLHGVDSDSEKE